MSTGPAFVTPAFGKRELPDERQRDRLHRDAEVHDDHGGDHLPDELDGGMQVEAVVESSDER